MASDQQINRLPGLLAVKMIWQQISLANRLTHQSPTRTDLGRQWRTRAEHSRRKSGPPLTSGLDVHENIDVSDTKLMLGLWVCFISSPAWLDSVDRALVNRITGGIQYTKNINNYVHNLLVVHCLFLCCFLCPLLYLVIERVAGVKREYLTGFQVHSIWQIIHVYNPAPALHCCRYIYTSTYIY